ncbi:MAG: aldose epimerase family protein [Pseudomonadota bacterium]
MIEAFGTSSDGQQVKRITLSCGDLSVSILTWGAAIQDVRLAGVEHALTLGSNRLANYEEDMRYHGTLIGPIANRISNGRVEIEGMVYELERNFGAHTLHSGSGGTQAQNWDLVDATDTSVTLRCDLGDGQCGLPGNRSISVSYSVSDPATLSMRIDATTDAPTLMNFANHSYWNLDGTDTWDGHALQVVADTYLPLTQDFRPDGSIAEVDGTDLDFRSPRRIAPKLPDLDVNFCPAETHSPIRDVLTLKGAGGIAMTVASDQKGIQVYDGRDAIRPSKSAYEGIAVEAQGWPDAPTHRSFPSIAVTPDAPYRQETSWRFSKV